MKNPEKLRILKHTLGLDRSAYSYRNCYSVHPEAAIHRIILEMVRDGYMEEYQRSVAFIYYRATDKGKAVADTKTPLSEYSDEDLNRELSSRGYLVYTEDELEHYTKMVEHSVLD